MRSLTSAEALVVASLLDSSAASQRERIQRSSLPTRTYEAAARRLLTSGLVYDRYLPNPSRLGVPFVTFALVHPFEERRDDLVRRWTTSPSCVVVWRSDDWAFGVFFRAPRGKAGARPPGLTEPRDCSREFLLTVDSRAPQVPVYFDFEGAWGALSGSRRSLSYPRPLPGVEAETSEVASPTARPGDLEAGRDLVGRTHVPSESGPSPQRRSPRFFTLRERRALARGIFVHRVLVDVPRIPATPGGVTQGVAFVQGRLRTSRGPEGLFAAALGRAGMAPFLFATDERRVLLGTFSRVQSPHSLTRPGREPLERVLQEYLEEIAVSRSPLESVRVEVDHRYERLLGRPAGDARPDARRGETHPAPARSRNATRSGALATLTQDRTAGASS